MQIIILKTNKINIINLPEKVRGSHFITTFENGKRINLINIEASENGWKVISNQDACMVNSQDEYLPYVILREGAFYILKNNFRNEKYYVYCAPLYDLTYKSMEIKPDATIKVGNSKNTDITYTLGTISGEVFEIKKENENYYLTLLSNNYLVYVNQKRVLSKRKIVYGDIIFLYGLKIILMKKNSVDYLLVNNPNNLLEYNIAYTNETSTKNTFVEDNQELNDESLYSADDYFYRTPRFYEKLEKFILRIDAPPTRKEEDKTPALLVIGPMLTMGMMSSVMLLNTFSNIKNGNSTVSSSLTSIITGCVMLASTLLWPLLSRAYQNFSNRKYEHKRQKLYKKYLDKKEKEIEKQQLTQKNSLLENNYGVQKCIEIITGHNTKLWQRRITDDDFLTLPVGIGSMPMQIKVEYPEEHFSLTEDNLLDLVHELGEKSRILEDVPITYSFYENRVTGIVGKPDVTKEFVDRMVLQIMTNYGYDEVKVVTFTSFDNEDDWDYIKTIPHAWSNDHTFRYFGSSNDDYREIIYSLEQVYNARVNSKMDPKVKPEPYYVIITDAIKSIDNYDFIKNILAKEQNYGFSLIMMVDRVSACPNECKNFINVSRDECQIFNSVINSGNQAFKIDFSSIDDLYDCAKILANINIEIKSEVESSLPDTYHFLEMYQVGKVEQLNVVDRWKKSNPMLSLQTPVGIGKSGEIISLDLHEKYHGPHGLIAGTTGSGKSEFIITYILSLAINYSPNEVQVILIDYKGGSLAGAFQNERYTLPHLAGTMTNLDGNELNRSLASIESEIKRRQKEFNEARDITGESAVDIYKYQKLWREGRLPEKDPIAHLFIISDEFAELKEQQPEFMDKLISTARVGRSLGVHLILATQKPGGVVDPQIWSNTKFRVCLKVQDTSDSQEVLKKPDAAYLKKTGRFYLQVGYDEVFTLGQAAWAGGQYIPNPTFKKEVDTSVNVINNIGFVTMTKETKEKRVVKAESDELTSIVSYLSKTAEEQNIKIKKLWLEKIPAHIFVNKLIEKYQFQKENFYFNPVIGEYDDPATQQQYVLTVPFSKHGNALIYGIAGSGKEMFLSSLVYSAMITYAPEEVNFYILDFGAETLRMYESSPYVGDIAYLNDADKIKNLFKMLDEEISRRKKLFAQYGGNYSSFIKNSSDRLPNIVVLINNYEAFSETYEDYLEIVNQLSRDAFKYGVFFMITASNDNSVRVRTKQNFAITYALQQNSDSDYSNILGNCRGKTPAKNKGRGLFKRDSILEFQTAMVTDEENETKIIQEFCQAYADSTSYRAKKIPVLPDVVDYQAIYNSLTKGSNLVVGISKNDLKVEKYNFSKNALNLISSYEISYTKKFVNALIDEVSYLKHYNLLFINASDNEFSNANIEEKTYTKNFDKLIDDLTSYLEEAKTLYEENDFDDSVLKDKDKSMCIIYGLYDFIGKLNDDAKKKFSELVKIDTGLNLISFVLIDNPDVIKQYAYEDWFKQGSDTSRGIWIGSGVDEQSLFRISKIDREDREEITNDYGFVINNSKISRIKLLSSFDAPDMESR